MALGWPCSQNGLKKMDIRLDSLGPEGWWEE
jgi:hypothetical protein